MNDGPPEPQIVGKRHTIFQGFLHGSGRVRIKPARTREIKKPPEPTRPDPTRPDPTRPDPTRPDPTGPIL